MKRNETPDILSRIRNMKFRKELTALLAFFVMISTSYAMIHPSEALNNNVARSFMFFEEEGTETELSNPEKMNALMDADMESGNTADPVQDDASDSQQEEGTYTESPSSEPAGWSSSEPTSTPAESVTPVFDSTAAPVVSASTEPEGKETSEPTGTPESLMSASPEASEDTETADPETGLSASPDATASTDPSASPSVEPTGSPEAEEEELYPATDFGGEIIPLEEDGTETKEDIRVLIKAPVGAFPAGTTVKVVLVRDTEILDAIEKAAVDATEKDVTVKRVQAVDITFTDKDGNEIQPNGKIAVSFKTDLVKEAESTTVVHVEQDENKENIIDTKTVDTVAKPEDSNLVDSIEDNEVVIEAESFSVYGIVGTETIETQIQTASGDTLKVTVEVSDKNDIDKFEGLRVSELDSESAAYQKAYDAVVAKKEATDQEFNEDNLGFFAADIELLDANGNEFEPEGAVKVTMELLNLPADESVLTSSMEIQHLAENNGSIEVQTVATSNDVEKVDDIITAEFTVDSFSTFTLTWTDGGGGVSEDAATETLNVQVSGTTYATVNVHYIDSNGNYITSPLNGAVSGISPVTLETLLNQVITDYTYQGIHYNSYNGDEITTIAVDREGESSQQYVSQGNTNNSGRPQGWNPSQSGTYYGDLNGTKQQIYYRYVSRNWRFMTNQNSNEDSYRYTNGTVYTLESISNYNFSMSITNGETEVANLTTTQTSATWTDAADIYVVYSGTTTQPHSTIHYGYMDGNTFVEFSEDELPVTPVEINSSGSTHFAYLIYDFDGYHYADETYYHTNATTTPRTGGTQTQPLLRWTGSGQKWTYTSSGDLHTYHNSSNQSDVANGSHLYVIYGKDDAIAQGGTPKVRPVNPDEEPEAPTLTKNSVNNGDGTNTISLDITGSTTKLEVEKLADVIVVFDVSSSMNRNLDGTGNNASGSYNINGTNRIANAGRAAESLAESLLAKKNSNGDPLVRMALVPFSMTASIHSFNGNSFTSDINEFKTAVEGLQMSSGTNWEDALMKANQLAVDSERATFVIFVTDGEPSMRVSRGNYTDAQIGSENGNAASYLAQTNYYGGLNSDNTKNYELAVPAAAAIVNANKNLYTIGVSSDVSTLTQLTIDSGAGADHSKTATDEDALVQAFNDIEASILALLGAGDVQITDGITSLSNLEAKVLETVDPNSFKYYRYGGWKTTTVDGEEVKTKDKYGADYEHKTEWTTRETDGCAAAAYDEATGSVQWNMGRNFQLEEDVTYVVEFRVWPSQTAYDLIANLDNGTKEYRVKTSDSDTKGLTQEEYDQVQYDAATDSYSLKTNTDEVGAEYTLCTKTGATVSYEDGATSKPVTYTEGTIENMELMSELMTIKKEWAHEFNDSHAGDQVKFYLKVGDAGYYQNDGTVSPSEANADSLVLSNPDWVQSIYIAPGMMDYDSATGEVHLLESGHEYELYEYEITQADSSDNYIASYDFISEIVRPMRVNGALKYLVKYTSDSEIPAGVTETYTIDGKTYYARPGSGDSGLLSGTNYRRAEMDITKIINKGTSSMTEEQLNKEVFTYRVTLRMPADANLSLITGWQFVYRPDNPNWTIQGYQAEDEPLAGDETRFAGNNFRWGTFNYNGTPIGEAVVTDPDDEGYVTITMDLSMYPNQVLRLTNLPMGTEYRIEEVYANNRTLGSNGLMSNASVVPTTSVESNLAAQGYTQISSASKYGTASGNVISGTIDNPNRRYYNQFTNMIDNIAAVDLQVTKHLDGYTWSGERYYFTLEAGVHKDADGTEVGTSPLPASTSLYLSNTTGSDDRSYGFGSVKYNEEGTYTYTVKEARYRPGDSTTIVDIDQTANTIPDTNIVFEKPVTITVTVSKNADGSLYVEKVEGTRTELTGTVINTTFTNSQPCYVKILKVGDSTTPLSEVLFTVYSDSNLTTPVTTDAKGELVGLNGVITTDNDGYASLGAMLSGATYYLVETSTVGGYNKLFDPVIISFSGSNVTASCNQENVVFDSPEWIYKDNDGTWVVKINNSSGAALPMTGGTGTLPYTIGGITVMLVALMYGFRMRRRERRLNLKASDLDDEILAPKLKTNNTEK